MPIETVVASEPLLEKVDEIIAKHHYEESSLIGILQDVQKEFNYLPIKALKHVAHTLDVPISRVYNVATFYRAFTLKPRGKYTISVCLGTACHVRGGKRVVEELERRLGIKAPDTTSDLKYSLQPVNCLGACALGPVIVVNGEYHGQVTPKKVEGILKKYQ